MKKLMFVLIAAILVMSLGCSKSSDSPTSPSAPVPSNNDFAGIWNGSIAGVAPDENINCTLTVNLAVNSNQLAGTMTGSNCSGGTMGSWNVSGTVSNGTFSFNFPNSDTTNPNCANWNMPATATLDSNLTTMTINSSGTVCGPGGGKPGSLTGTATKQ